MQNSANVSLSAFEKQLVMNADFILTKNVIIQKVYQLFGVLSHGYQKNSLLQSLPSEILIQSPKISRGENYEGLPYVMLDYPRCFGKEDVFAIRTFFWWGHFFSSTLQLKGKYKVLFQSALMQNMKDGMMDSLGINITEEEWIHHLNEDQVQMIMSDSEINFNEKNLIKISSKLNLNEWDFAEDFLLNCFNRYLMLLQSASNTVK
jgi:hypothetical protein